MHPTQLTTVAFLVAAASSVVPSPGEPPELTPRLESYVTRDVKLTAGERNRLRAGGPVTKLLDADASKEVSVFGAIWIDAPIHRYVEAVQAIESLERGAAFRITKRISDPPRLDDFAGLRLPETDVAHLRSCQVGDCAIKLDERAIERFRSELDWNTPNPRAAADALFQRIAFDYVTAYLEGGNDRLMVYRDKSRPRFTGREFGEMIDLMPELTRDMPGLHQHLLQFPKATLPDATSFLYWQETDFGLKPTIRISHLTVQESAQGAVVASKMIYASHYFWTALELRMLIPDPARGAGFWFVTVNRSRSDGLSGFTGLFVRGRVRSKVRDGSLSALQITKRKLEDAAPAGRLPN